MTLDRIKHDPQVMAGRPTVKGTRVTVSMIVRQLAEGESLENLLKRYSYLERKDVVQALQYAAHLKERVGLEHAV